MLQHLRVFASVAWRACLHSACCPPCKPDMASCRTALRGGQHGSWPLHIVAIPSATLLLVCPTANINHFRIFPFRTGIRVLEGVEHCHSPHLLYGHWILPCPRSSDCGESTGGAWTLPTRRHDTCSTGHRAFAAPVSADATCEQDSDIAVAGACGGTCSCERLC